MNRVFLIGRLTADPEIRTTANGKLVASYSLAVNRSHKAEGQPEADFLNCIAWGNAGMFARDYLRKGAKIAVEGQIQTRTYNDKDGKKVYVTEIVVSNHEFCESKKNQNNASFTAAPMPTQPSAGDTPHGFDEFKPLANDDDVPF